MLEHDIADCYIISAEKDRYESLLDLALKLQAKSAVRITRVYTLLPSLAAVVNDSSVLDEFLLAGYRVESVPRVSIL